MDSPRISSGVLVCLVLSFIPLRVMASTVTFTFVNACNFMVWPGILSNAGSYLPVNGGFSLPSSHSASLVAPRGWSGRFWGRAGCSFTSGGQGVCASGDCAGRLQCEGAGATPPATLAEFSLAGIGSTSQDFYDVSLVDGHNLPMSITPHGGTGNCAIAGCINNVNLACPSELQVVQEGSVVACRSACDAFKSAEFCCSGAYGSPNTCKPSTYSELFKAACPSAYSYAYDDPTSTFTCGGTVAFTITFCPIASSPRSSNNTNGVFTNGAGIMAAQIWKRSSHSTNGAPSISHKHAHMLLTLGVTLITTIVILCGSLDNHHHAASKQREEFYTTQVTSCQSILSYNTMCDTKGVKGTW